MRRRDILLAILLAPWPALGSSPEEAKKRDPPKPKPPPPKPPSPGKPKKGDGVAPLDDQRRAPDGDPLPPWRR